MKKIKIIILAALILSLIIFAKPIYKTITGLASDIVSLFLSTAPLDDICVYPIEVPPPTVYIRGQFTVKFEILNCGSTKLDTITEEVGIADSDGNYKTLANVTTFYDVNPSQRKLFIYSWTPYSSPGINYFFLKVYYGNSYKQYNYSFYVLRPPDIPAEKAPIEGISGLEGEIKPGFYLDLSFNKMINLTQGESYILLIKATNIGDKDLHNIYIRFLSNDLQTRIIYPNLVDVLTPTESAIFIGELIVPEDTPSGQYNVVIEGFSKEISTSGNITVNVQVLAIKEKAKELILYYSQIIDDLDKEIKIQEKEKNVTEAKQFLEEAKKELDAAKEFYKMGWYREVINQIEKVKEKVNQVVLALGEAKAWSKKVIKLPAIPFVYLLLVLLSVVFSIIIFFIFKKRREDREFVNIKKW